MDVEEEGVGIELAEDGAFVGAGLGVPLGAGAPPGEEGEWVFLAAWFGEGGWGGGRAPASPLRRGQGPREGAGEEARSVLGIACKAPNRCTARRLRAMRS